MEIILELDNKVSSAVGVCTLKFRLGIFKPLYGSRDWDEQIEAVRKTSLVFFLSLVDRYFIRAAYICAHTVQYVQKEAVDVPRRCNWCNQQHLSC
jgi:hypothetical protein